MIFMVILTSGKSFEDFCIHMEATFDLISFWLDENFKSYQKISFFRLSFCQCEKLGILFLTFLDESSCHAMKFIFPSEFTLTKSELTIAKNVLIPILMGIMLIWFPSSSNDLEHQSCSCRRSVRAETINSILLADLYSIFIRFVRIYLLLDSLLHDHYFSNGRTNHKYSIPDDEFDCPWYFVERTSVMKPIEAKRDDENAVICKISSLRSPKMTQKAQYPTYSFMTSSTI